MYFLVLVSFVVLYVLIAVVIAIFATIGIVYCVCERKHRTICGG